MKLFNNVTGAYERLINMYPSYYHDVYEMQEILKAQGTLSDKLHADIERIFNNQFIDYADENIISGYEKKLGITTESSASLEERRKIVKSHLMGNGKISVSIVKEMIEAYTGAEASCRLIVMSANRDYGLHINIERGSYSFFNMKDICSFLDIKLPAHIKYNMYVNYKKEIEFIHSYEFNNTTLPKCGEFISGEEVSICF